MAISLTLYNFLSFPPSFLPFPAYFCFFSLLFTILSLFYPFLPFQVLRGWMLEERTGGRTEERT